MRRIKSLQRKNKFYRSRWQRKRAMNDRRFRRR